MSFFINSTTLQKSEKSLAFDPLRGYFSKNGIIFSVISENFVTTKLTADPKECGSTIPQQKK